MDAIAYIDPSKIGFEAREIDALLVALKQEGLGEVLLFMYAEHGVILVR